MHSTATNSFPKKHWPKTKSSENAEDNKTEEYTSDNHYSLYHVEYPHIVRNIYNHHGAAPRCRSNPYTSMDLLRHVLQSSITQDFCEVFEKYRKVVEQAAVNTRKNFAREPLKTQPLAVDCLVIKFFDDAIDKFKEVLHEELKSKSTAVLPPSVPLIPAVEVIKNDCIAIQQPQQVLSPFKTSSLLGKHNSRADSPDLLNKRLKIDTHVRRSLSPARPPKKTNRADTPVSSGKAYNSPYRPLKSETMKKIEKSWDPSSLTSKTQFVMGTKANRALGLGATRGRIYMKHPELFKYSGDHEDKKWMVKNNCMAATGGKNTFIMIAEDVISLYHNEYKDSPGTMISELNFFHLPEFVLRKMRSAMANDKMLRINGMQPTGRPPEGCPSLPTTARTAAEQKRSAAAAELSKTPGMLALCAASVAPSPSSSHHHLQVRVQQTASPASSPSLVARHHQHHHQHHQQHQQHHHQQQHHQQQQQQPQQEFSDSMSDVDNSFDDDNC